jgi:formylglycine-generating enzyme required for sulfatase activity
MKLVLIPAGKFTMGSPDNEQGRESNEGPQREVTISRPFFMGIYEVTQKQYEQIMGNKACGTMGDKYPMESVSWDEAVEFCRKVSQKTGKTVKLPSEAQWEYACRAGTKTRFNFGDKDEDLSEYGWWGGDKGNSDKKTHPVGQKKPNNFGLYDMHGNVCEWCSDWYDYYPRADARDPQGPEIGNYRLQRGGCWSFNPRFCRSAARVAVGAAARVHFAGFRVVVELK